MSYFLLKTEPSEYSFEDLIREGETVWDGVTNNLALKTIRLMKPGDYCLIYHSGGERAVVGKARVTSAAYPDPKKADVKLAVVNIKAVGKLRKAVPLSELKDLKAVKNFDLIRLPRLSVMEVPGKIWNLIIGMAKEK